jgi:hypothetical protein
MAVMCTHGAGLDVHQKRITACRATPDPTGQQADGLLALREFGTMTIDLLALADWLAGGASHLWRGRAPAATGSRSTTSWRGA